jgi:flagellar basal-body rod protein FlgC
MSLFDALNVSASGMSAQRARADVIAENMANSETTRTAAGGPYKRKQVVFESASPAPTFASLYDVQLQGAGMDGVAVQDVIEDPREAELRYLPGHPDANDSGYVAFPNVDPTEEMVDLMNAARGFEANVSVATAVKDMIHRSLDLMR